MRAIRLVVPCVAVLFAAVGHVYAAQIFFTDKAAWEAAVSGEQDFEFTSANVGTANEVSPDPGPNTGVGNTLTFAAANTGLPVGFTFSTLQSGASFTFDDDELAGNIPDFDDALSVGDIDNFEDDDWRMVFTAGIFAFGFDLYDNGSAVGESFSVFGSGNVLLATTTSIPATGARLDFVGVISDIAILSVEFDEDSGGDDIAIGGISLSTQTQIPEPSSLALLAMGGAGLMGYRRRKRKQAA